MELYAVTAQRASARAGGGRAADAVHRRQAELDAIAAHWRDAVEGRPAPAVLVSGGAGIGKSRLIHEAAARVGAEQLLCRCSGYRRTTSLHAFRGLLEAVCGIAADDGPDARLQKLRAAGRSRPAAAGERALDPARADGAGHGRRPGQAAPDGPARRGRARPGARRRRPVDARGRGSALGGRVDARPARRPARAAARRAADRAQRARRLRSRPGRTSCSRASRWPRCRCPSSSRWRSGCPTARGSRRPAWTSCSRAATASRCSWRS